MRSPANAGIFTGDLWGIEKEMSWSYIHIKMSGQVYTVQSGSKICEMFLSWFDMDRGMKSWFLPRQMAFHSKEWITSPTLIPLKNLKVPSRPSQGGSPRAESAGPMRCHRQEKAFFPPRTAVWSAWVSRSLQFIPKILDSEFLPPRRKTPNPQKWALDFLPKWMCRFCTFQCVFWIL